MNKLNHLAFYFLLLCAPLAAPVYTATGAEYALQLSTGFSETGDDLYVKYTDSDFSGSNWTVGNVSAIEFSDTNVYELDLDETKAAIVYLNGHAQEFSANAGDDVITATAHGLLNGETLRFKGSDLPGGLSQTTIFFIRDKSDNTFKVSATSGGEVVDLTDVGSGTFTFTSPAKRSKALDTKIGVVPKVRDTELEGEAETLALLAAIKAKTDLIGTVKALIRW